MPKERRAGRGELRESERGEQEKREGMTATREDDYRVKQRVVRAHRSWQVGPLGIFRFIGLYSRVVGSSGNILGYIIIID